ncbi:hypothetical protein CHH83_01790 [Bacillus sp. 7586-K]|nr:hypothetical protein CHH83_01790 [Bacillus sp. 7586-K]
MFYSKRIKKLESTLERALEKIRLLENEINALKIEKGSSENNVSKSQANRYFNTKPSNKLTATFKERKSSQVNNVTFDPIMTSMLYNHINEDSNKSLHDSKVSDDSYKSNNVVTDYSFSYSSSPSYTSESSSSYSSSSSSSYDSSSSYSGGCD